jgi:hypothetical protein
LYGSKNRAVLDPSEPSAKAFSDPSRNIAFPDPAVIFSFTGICKEEIGILV